MGRPVLILAALAADADASVFFSRYESANSKDLDAINLEDAAGGAYSFKMAATPRGQLELATEQQVLGLLASVSEGFEFETPRVLGRSVDEFGEPGILFSQVAGNRPSLAKLGPGEFTASFGRALAAIHSIPLGVIRDAGLPDFDATAVLHQKVGELDAMAASGRIPADLLSRWERALEDVGLYRFHPTVVHGGLSSDSVRLAGNTVYAIDGWQSMRVADPAEDFIWLMQGALDNTQEDTLLHYRAARGEADENLLQRATLYAEMQLGNWLVHCLELGDAEEIAAAEDLLSELRAELDAGALRDLRATSFVGLATTSLLSQMTSELPVIADEAEPTNEGQEELF